MDHYDILNRWADLTEEKRPRPGRDGVRQGPQAVEKRDRIDTGTVWQESTP